MAYLNNNNNFYSPFATPNEFDPYPFLQSQKFADPEEAYYQPTHTFTDSWSTADRPGPLTNVSANYLGATNYGEESFGLFIDLCLRTRPYNQFPPLLACTRPPHSGSFGRRTTNSLTQDTLG